MHFVEFHMEGLFSKSFISLFIKSSYVKEVIFSPKIFVTFYLLWEQFEQNLKLLFSTQIPNIYILQILWLLLMCPYKPLTRTLCLFTFVHLLILQFACCPIIEINCFQYFLFFNNKLFLFFYQITSTFERIISF